MVRVRYAPSPTGEIHIGNARTALFNYLFARHERGTFVLRLDDTDRRRSTEEAIKSMIQDVNWLGIDWDEGYLKGGEFGPYRQSERMDIYNHYVDTLLERGSAYELYYTEEEIQSIREEYEKTLTVFSYRKLKENETEERRKSFKDKGISPAIVFKVEEDVDIKINDLVRGEVHFSSSEFSDFVIKRSNGIPIYNYATVIDDALMKITHVIRAEEHLSNTPKQILIFKALDFDLPVFAHISLILAEDRTKLSKRHGATSIGQFRDMGFLPEAMFNFLALLGWSPKDNREFFSKEELIELFTIESVNKAPAVFDINKLKWMNHRYIENLSEKEIYDKAKEIGIKFEKRDKDWWLGFIVDMKEHFNTLKDIDMNAKPLFDEFILNEAYIDTLKNLHVLELLNEVKNKLEEIDIWDKEKILEAIRITGKELQIKGKNLYFPIRLAVTGKDEGMEVHEYMYFIGKEETLMRLKQVSGGLNA
jgi:glutamyl-tRNA synthetase